MSWREEFDVVFTDWDLNETELMVIKSFIEIAVQEERNAVRKECLENLVKSVQYQS